MSKYNLPYDLDSLKREDKKYYISASQEELHQMLDTVKKKELRSLYSHLEEELFFRGEKLSEIKKLPELEYEELLKYFDELSKKNNIKTSFLGDGIKSYSLPDISRHICTLRGLTTAYTPYQPERSQGTLWSLWIYSNMLSRLTGFEAINASLYDRSTGLFEAINTAKKIKRTKKNTFIISEGLNPRDINVIETLTKETSTKLVYAPIDSTSGRTDKDKLEKIISEKNIDPLLGRSIKRVRPRKGW